MSVQYIDWLVILTYILFIFILAFWSGKAGKLRDKSLIKNPNDEYLASKSLTFTESICSIIATEVSALTFLGIPAFAFNKNFSFVQIYMGAIFGRYIIAKVFLPKIYDRGLTIYEVMASSNGLPSGQRTVGILYTISKILSVGVRLFSGSILVSHFLGVNVYLGLATVTFITFLYTLIGGLKAVVRTDIMQMGLFISGGLLAHYLIPNHSGQSWWEMMELAQAAGKTTIIDFSNPLPFIFGILGGFLFDMSTHGVDQDFVQRLTANKSLRHGQMAIFFSSFISIAVGLLFLGVGALLYVHYQNSPFPEGVENADHLFSHFIVNYFPVGIRGIMVAGVLAATMSTLDSTINALSATLYNDIISKKEALQIKYFSFYNTLVITFLLFLIALVASKNEGLLLLGLKIQSWTGGPLLALFVAKVILKRIYSFQLSTTAVIGSYAAGTLGVYINSQVLQWDWNLNVYWGFLSALLFLKLYDQLKSKK
jgi:solute:Na+ symporter, SSS family